MTESQVVLITGCSNGFGRQLVESLARRGHTVYATMREVRGRNAGAATELRELASREGLRVRVLELDVTSTEQVDAAVARMVDETGGVDVVVQNAGVMSIGVTEAYTVEQFQTQLETNVVGVHRLNRAVLPHMRRQGSGLLVHVSSVAGRIAAPCHAIYDASKFALEGYAEALRYELATLGIDSIIVEPGPFHTNLIEMSPRPEDTARAEEYGALAEIPDFFRGMYNQMFADPSLPTDPQMVVDVIVRLIETPAGERPLRTTVGVEFGVARYNEAVAPIGEEVLAAAGMGHMLHVGAAKQYAGEVVVP